MCKRIMVVVMLAVVMLSGCVEVAFRSQGHFATQAPKLTTSRFTYDYAEPLGSQEVVNAEHLIKNSAQPQIIVVPDTQNREQQYPTPPVYATAKGLQLVKWGNLEDK